MAIIDVRFFCFYLNFQTVDDLLAQKLHFFEHHVDILAARGARQTGQERDEHALDRRPIALRALFHGSRYQLANVAAAERQRLFRALELKTLGSDLLRQVRQLARTGEQRRETEAESGFDVPSPAPMCIALAIRAIAALDQSGIDQCGKMPAQGRPGDAVRAQRQLLVRRENNQTAALVREFIIRIEAQQGLQHRYRTILEAEHILHLADVVEDFPLIDRVARIAVGGFELASHQGKRHRPPMGRCHTSNLHFFHLSMGKRNPLTKTVPKTLDCDSWKCDSRSC